MKEKKNAYEEEMMPELTAVEAAIAHDVVDQVEHEIDMIADSVEHDHTTPDFSDNVSE